MRLDLSKLIGAAGARLPFEGECDLSQETMYGERPFQHPVTYAGAIENQFDVLQLTGTIKTIYSTCCARCLKPLDILLTAQADMLLTRDPTAEERDDVFLLSDESIEVEDVLVPEMLLQVDRAYLCKEDCRGLCPRCGCDLNETACSCESRQIDPRFAVLAALLQDKPDEQE